MLRPTDRVHRYIVDNISHRSMRGVHKVGSGAARRAVWGVGSCVCRHVAEAVRGRHAVEEVRRVGVNVHQTRPHRACWTEGGVSRAVVVKTYKTTR